MDGMSNYSERPGPEIMVRYQIDGLGYVPAFKNSKQIITVKGRMMLVAKKEFKKWMDTAILMLRGCVRKTAETARAWQKRDTPKGKDRLVEEHRKAVSVRVGLYYSALNSPDITGALETAMDVLRDAGAIADDSPRYVKSASVHWYPCDKGKEGAQIAITID